MNYRFTLISVIFITSIILNCSDSSLSTNDVTTGLVGYWPMDEAKGDSAMDVSGNNNNIGNESVKLVWKTEGKKGSAIEFNGKTSYLEQIDSKLSENFPGKGESKTGSMTVTAWIYSRANVYQMIAAKDQADGRSFNFSITGSANLGKLSVQIGTADSMYRFNGEQRVKLNVWNHVAMVYTFINDTASTITTYLNGKLDSAVSDVIGPINATATPFRVGARSYNNQLSSFDGYLDEVKIYNRELTPDQIMESFSQ